MVDTVFNKASAKRAGDTLVLSCKLAGDPGSWRSLRFRRRKEKDSVHNGTDRDEAPFGERRTASPFFRLNAGTTKLSGLSLGAVVRGSVQEIPCWLRSGK